MIVLVVLVGVAVAGLFVAGFLRAAGRRPWWEQMHDDLDVLPTTRKGPGADAETLPPDDHETR